MKKIARFIIGLALCQAFSFASDTIDFSSLKEDVYWQKILHYQPSVIGHLQGKKIKGQADGAGFYFSPEGKWNLVNEAYASYQAFRSDLQGDPNFHPQCRFPERYRYLKEKFKLDIKDIFCPDYQEWINSLDPVGAALVFASNYPNNPGSAMGHTFLRIISRKTSRLQNGKYNDRHLDLLDYSISYAAMTSEDKGISYAVNGIVGGFLGQFTMQPYYMKVREYNEGEGRDLWEYELNIDESSVRKMVANFWEVSKNTYFNYFFLDENCSFHMLTLLDVARPDWNLSQKFYFYTIPYETIKAVAEIPDAIVSKKYRPSLPKRSEAIIARLSTSEKQDFKKIIDKSLSLSKYEHNADFLEAFATYLHYKKIENELKFPVGHGELYTQALIYRSKLSPAEEKAKSFNVPEEDRPDIGHSSSQVELGAGFLKNKFIQTLKIKAGLQDLISKDAGFSANSRLNFMQLNLLHYKKKLKVDEFIFLDILSLVPVKEHEKNTSWGLKFSILTPKDKALTQEKTFEIKPTYGLTYTPWNLPVAVYTLGFLNLEYATFTKSNLRLAPGVLVGTLIDLKHLSKFNFETQLWKNILKEENNKIHTSFELNYSYFLSQNLELRTSSTLYLDTPFSAKSEAEQNYARFLFGAAYSF